MLKLELPFDHQVIGYMSAANQTFVTVCRDHRYHPFVTYDVEMDGVHCTGGGYYATRSAAFEDLYNRIRRRIT